jgi:hypothetical protein
MHRKSHLILILSVLIISIPYSGIATPSSSGSVNSPDEVPVLIEETLEIRGTIYHIEINKRNHTVKVSAEHIADNRTHAGFTVSIDDQRVIGVGWEPNQGDTRTESAELMMQYNAMREEHSLIFSTYGNSTTITYDFIVPRKYKGRYLRPTLTDVQFERISRSKGRMTVTFRSDALLNYPTYFRVWTPNVQARNLELYKKPGQNVSTASIILPVPRGEPFEGEIRMFPARMNETTPIHTQYEFYGYPGQSSLKQVPYEPLSSIEVRESYQYVNESRTETGESVFSHSQYRIGIAGIAATLVVLLMLAIALSHRRREV